MPTGIFAPRMQAKARFLRVLGQDVHLLEAGPSSGVPLLLVHGASGGAGWYWRNVPALVRAGFRVVLPDLPGFGESSRPAGNPPVTFEWYGELLAGVLAALGEPRADVVGLSLGGAAALSLALERPLAVRRLVLIAPAALGDDLALPFRLMAIPGLGELVVHPHPALVRSFHASYLYGRRGFVDEEMLFYDFASQARPGSAETLLSLVRRPGRSHRVVLGGQRDVSFVPRLTSLAVPTLLVWGRQDRIFPLAHGLEAARRLPDGRVRVIEDAGHMPHFERPEAFHEALVQFLGAAPSAA